MGFVKFEMNELRYASLFAQQTGFGMPKYRGSPMTGGSFWGRIIGFARGLFSKAAPHISDALLRAQPHVKNLASRGVESVIDTAVEQVQKKIKEAQEGKGIKGRTQSRKVIRKKLAFEKLPDKF